MEYSKIIEYKVGVFIVIATLITLGFIMALGGDRALFTRHYHLVLEADETMGLNQGSMVQVSGMPCGNVDKVEFEGESNRVRIWLRIDRRFQNRITEGSTITTLTQGALGDKYLSIQPGAFNGKPLQDGDPIAGELNRDFLGTLGRSGDKIEKAFVILDNIEKLVQELNRKNTAENTGELMRHLKISATALDEILGSVRGSDPKKNAVKKSLDHLASILEKVDSGQGTLGGLINDPTVHEDLKALMGGAKRNKLLKYLIRQTIQKSEDEAVGASAGK